MNQSTMTVVETEAKRNIQVRNPLDLPIELVARRFGNKAKEVERFLRFAVVGVSGAMVDFGVLIILQATILEPTHIFGSHLFHDTATANILHLDEVLNIPVASNVAIATSIAFILAVISNFIWTQMWVYPESRANSMRRQLAQFTLISVTGGFARSVWVTTMSFRLGPIILPTLLPLIHIFNASYDPNPTAEAKLGSIVAQLIGMAVIMLWNFFANRYWTYGDVK
ncbi:MAG: GtrA family protein [Aggregatilineales bacterium]